MYHLVSGNDSFLIFHRGGQRDSADTFFTRKTMSEEELNLVFSNIEEIISLNSKFLVDLESRFETYTDDQGLTDIFAKYAESFSAYVPYIVGYDKGKR